MSLNCGTGLGMEAWKCNGAEVKIMVKTVKVLTVTECNGGVADCDLWMDGISDVPCRDGDELFSRNRTDCGYTAI